MTQLVLIDGAPGSGKSTLASALAQDHPLALALDIDGLKHALGGWEQDLWASGLRARRLAVALIREQLSVGGQVFIGQYLAKPDFIVDLELVAVESGAIFHEFALDIDDLGLAKRLSARQLRPTRQEHPTNRIEQEEVHLYVQSMYDLRAMRPKMVPIDAKGTLEETLKLLRNALSSRPAGK